MVSIEPNGRVESTPLPELLLELYRSRYGGVLLLSRDHVGKRFQFHGGAPVFGESNLPSESLRAQLLAAHSLERRDAERLEAHMQRTGAVEAAALLELRLIEPKELFHALREQLRLSLIECFGWAAGRYTLDAGDETPADAQPFRLDVLQLVQQGLEAYWSSERVFTALQPRMESYPREASALGALVPRLLVDDAVDAAVEALDGTRTLWQVLSVANTPRALAAVWLLDAVGAIGYASEAASTSYDPDADDAEAEIVIDAPGGAPAEAAPAEPTAEPVAARTPEPAPAARPAPTAAAPAPDRAEALRAEIESRHAQLEAAEKPDHYTLLGVEPDAGAGDIRRAYLLAAKSYHPDALARVKLDTELRARASRVFAQIGKAHAVLSDPAARNEYDVVRRENVSDGDAERIAQAETLYRKGAVLLRQGNFRGALEYLAPAVDLWPDEAVYQSAFGWALFKKTPPEPDAAREHLERALELDPSDAETRSRLDFVTNELDGAAEPGA